MASQAKDLASDIIHLHNTMMAQSPLYKTTYIDLQDRVRAMEQKLPSIIRQLTGRSPQREETLYGLMGCFCALTEEDYYWMSYHQGSLEILSDDGDEDPVVPVLLAGINDMYAAKNAGETYLNKLLHIVFKLRHGRPMPIYDPDKVYVKLLGHHRVT